MTTEDFITELFCKVDDQLNGLPKHTQALLYPSEVVTIGLLYAIKGGYFYRWLSDNFLPVFPKPPHRTRLFRVLRSHQGWTQPLLALNKSPPMSSILSGAIRLRVCE